VTAYSFLGRIMRLSKANIAGLTSPLQQAEMKSILAGAWPPLKPLPVFKYETVEYRASIEFDKKRGEWVCRKTSLPSNKIQELRGGLREITMALPHSEAEMFTEGAEQQEQELERDTNRRLQAIHEWREKYENGGLYFELRDCLSESQRTEIDDSLRLSLTARQLQFNSKNVAYVFDALSTAGGRFAALIEFAKRNKGKLGTVFQAQERETAPEVERAIDPDKQPLRTSSSEPFVRDQEGAERRTDHDEFPAVSIKDVLPEQDQALAERLAHAASQQSGIETSEIVDTNSPPLVEHRHQEGHHSLVFTGLAPQVQKDQSFADCIERSSSRFPALEISGYQVALFAVLFLFVVMAFAVGLTGRGPLGTRFREASKSLLAIDAKSPPPVQADQSTSRIATKLMASTDDPTGTGRPDGATPSGEKSKDSARGSEYFSKVSSMDSDSSPTESNPSAKPELNSENRGPTGLIARGEPPPASSKRLAPPPKAVGPISSAPRDLAPYKPAPNTGAVPHLPRPSTILVTVPGWGSQPFTVSFPEKAIAATSSVAMTSQLSVLVSPAPGPALGHRSARLETGELVSFVWPRYRRPKDRYGLAETIRVRATVGPFGQVLEVKFLSGSISLLPATMRAVRQWRYRPTLLDKKPVQTQQDVTIEFRPPQYSSRMSQHASHN
jgi:periplasmic protein TonB